MLETNAPPQSADARLRPAFGIPEPDISEPRANEEANNDDQVTRLSRAEGRDLPEAPGGYDDFMVPENRPADSATGLVSLAFIKAAIRRGARFWCATAALGFLIGFGLTVWHPTPYQASTSVLLTYGPYENHVPGRLTPRPLHRAALWRDSPCASLGLKRKQ